MTAAQALLLGLSLATAQRRTLKAKAWFGTSNNRKQSVPLSQHDGNADEPYLVHDVQATKKTAITHDKFHGLYPCQIGTPCPSYSAAFLASRLQVVDNAVTPNRMRRRNTNMESASYKLGVLYLRSLGVCGGFTPSTRVVSRREGDGWFLFRF
tara:strand:- start:86 stop:544 length:459 start_codon:yes stop_codon:yes gene_type:complete